MPTAINEYTKAMVTYVKTNASKYFLFFIPSHLTWFDLLFAKNSNFNDTIPHTPWVIEEPYAPEDYNLSFQISFIC